MNEIPSFKLSKQHWLFQVSPAVLNVFPFLAHSSEAHRILLWEAGKLRLYLHMNGETVGLEKARLLHSCQCVFETPFKNILQALIFFIKVLSKQQLSLLFICLLSCSSTKPHKICISYRAISFLGDSRHQNIT